MKATPDEDLRRFEKYLRELETSWRKLATENAQLRVSHSFRLGQAFVRLAKRPRPSSLVSFFRDLRAAFRPMNAAVPRPPKRPPIALAAAAAVPDFLRRSFDEPPVGSAISSHIHAHGPVIVGIMGEDLRSRLGDRIRGGDLVFDRYDRQWAGTGATHLLLEADRLPLVFGWENAFTLREPAATIEAAAMLQKARQAGIRCVLVEPSSPHLYPLLSRVRPLFDQTLKRDAVTLESLGTA